MGVGLERKEDMVGKVDKKSRKLKKNEATDLEVVSDNGDAMHMTVDPSVKLCKKEKKEQKKKKSHDEAENARDCVEMDNNNKEKSWKKKRKLELERDEKKSENLRKRDKRTKFDKDHYCYDVGAIEVKESSNEKACVGGEENERLQKNFRKDMGNNFELEARKDKKKKHKECRNGDGFDIFSISKEFIENNKVGKNKGDEGRKSSRKEEISEMKNVEGKDTKNKKKKKKKKKKRRGERGKEVVDVGGEKNIADGKDSRKAEDCFNGDIMGKAKYAKEGKRKKKKGMVAEKSRDGSTITEDEEFVDKEGNSYSFRNKIGEGEIEVCHVEMDKGCKNKMKKAKSDKNGFERGPSTKISDETTDQPENSKIKGKSKRVSFSGNVEVFPLSDGPSIEEKNQEENLVRGKRFSREEDEMIKEAVSNYIREHGLGEEGLKMVMHCRSHPGMKNCWKEIGAALPWRPYESIYYRAHILFERDESRVWTPEEYELIKRYHEQHGSDWKVLADALGKHRFHVKDTWRRIKLPNMKKGHWSQEEYQTLFDLVNMDLRMKAFEEKKSKHGMLRDNICWGAISDKLSTRTNATCCQKWYDQLTSPMVAEGKWADADDYRLLDALYCLDACCIEDVDWDSLLEHRSGDVCRKRWSQMVNHIGKHGNKSFAEQVEVLSKRYCPELLGAREAYDSKPVIP